MRRINPASSALANIVGRFVLTQICVGVIIVVVLDHRINSNIAIGIEILMKKPCMLGQTVG